jgi:hypothetical protein
MTLSPAILSGGTVGVACNQTIVGIGGPRPYTAGTMGKEHKY